MIRWYEPTETELLICDLYQAYGIFEPSDMDIDLIAAIWGADLLYYPGKPCTEWGDDGAVILLTKGSGERAIRAAAFHELCHIAKHEGNQDDLCDMFRELQEIQATNFQLVSAMPYYMLPLPVSTWDEYTGILSDTFRVPISLAMLRTEHIIARMKEDYHISYRYFEPYYFSRKRA